MCSSDLYLETGEGWMYLAVILDAWSRRVLGWACAPTLAAPLVVAALQQALKHRRPPAGTIHHSDRGSQYTDAQLLGLLDTAGMARSMSRAGNCYDNAMMESLWATLKKELVHDQHFRTHAEARTAIFEWIEVWYQRIRIHGSLGYVSPEAFEATERVG